MSLTGRAAFAPGDLHSPREVRRQQGAGQPVTSNRANFKMLWHQCEHNSAAAESCWRSSDFMRNMIHI
jgi:hypothetical protein